MAFKQDPSLWFPKELLSLSDAEFVTDQQYCSKTAQQSLYTIAAKLRASNTEEWNVEWDIASLLRSGAYYNNFRITQQIQVKMKGSLKTVPQDDASIPKKKVSLAQLNLYPETNK